jgi:hypothetical protein
MALTLAGCIGGSLSTPLTNTSPAAAPDVFACTRNQLKAVGYDQASLDTDELRVSGRKIDDSQRRPDTQFRRMVERIEVDVGPASNGALSEIVVDAKTFAEMTTQRGPTEVQEKTSAAGREAARTILQKCSQPVDSTSVPG